MALVCGSLWPLVLNCAAHDGSLSVDMVTSSNQHIVNIDADYKDPQLCSLYAPDIYNHLRVAEVCAVWRYLICIEVPF